MKTPIKILIVVALAAAVAAAVALKQVKTRAGSENTVQSQPAVESPAGTSTTGAALRAKLP
jgi:hypothetical protein